jgi:glycosyltransferase involved in cell wall biosynthesis
LRIAGTGDPGYVDSLKARLQASGLADRVEFVGNLDQQALAEFVGRARLQVIPSIWYENLPNALLEAFASSTPIVASAIGSLQDAIVDGQTGFLFAPGDAEALAKVLARAFDTTESELTRMASRARTLAETDYSEQRHVEALEALLASVAHVL